MKLTQSEIQWLAELGKVIKAMPTTLHIGQQMNIFKGQEQVEIAEEIEVLKEGWYDINGEDRFLKAGDKITFSP